LKFGRSSLTLAGNSSLKNYALPLFAFLLTGREHAENKSIRSVMLNNTTFC
jgi:hypothetical protein